MKRIATRRATQHPPRETSAAALTDRPSLELRDLEVVVALASAGSTVRAAAALHVTQSAVSRALRLAESKLGLALFDRTARGLVPTAAGRRLVHGAGPVFGALLELERRIQGPASEPLRLRITSECYTAYRWLPSTLATLRATGAALDVTLAPEHTAAPIRALLRNQIDVALITTSVVPTSIGQRALFADELVFVMAPSHPLAARASLTPADLSETVLIVSSQTPAPETRWFMNLAFGRTKPRLTFLRFPLTEAIIDAARAGMGVAVLSEWVAAPSLGSSDLVARRLGRIPLRRPWRMAFRREASAAAGQLAAALAHAAPRLDCA